MVCIAAGDGSGIKFQLGLWFVFSELELTGSSKVKVDSCNSIFKKCGTTESFLHCIKFSTVHFIMFAPFSHRTICVFILIR